MPSFTQFAGLAVVVLSLGYFANALPVLGNISLFSDVKLVCNGEDAYSLVIAKFLLNIEALIKAIVACGTIADLKIAVSALCAHIELCANDLLAVGAGVVVAAEAKTQIVACIVGVITLVVRACLAITLKFGLSVCIDIFAQIDIALKSLLINLDVCIAGIVSIIAHNILSITVGLLAQLQLKLCLGVLGL
ncbi:unnamed protein product [Rhizoctonia solani]|uniref:Transmembrane protein n=1 Tax=Rhizoctonia solani TaxID=456999 RepID=A0A8H2Y1W5_9AGAM|nr:unnamed protein product [Rhizoctonia solani]